MSYINGTYTCDKCGKDCGDGAIPADCSPLIVPADNTEGRELKHFCPDCTQAILTFVST